MTKQPLKLASRRFQSAHIFFWMFYAVIVIAVGRAYNDGALEGWSSVQKLALAFLPVAPVAVWAYVAGRYWSRSPDEMYVEHSIKAAATAGACLAIILFAAGWITLIAGPDAFPSLELRGFDASPWMGVAIFLTVYTLQFMRLRRRAIS